MIGKILFLIAALLTQEMVLLNTLFALVHQGIYPLPLISLLLVVGTAIDIVIGYYIGRFLQRKTSQTKIGRYIKNLAEQYAFPENSPRRWLTMLIIGNFSFSYINAAVAGYLELPFWESQAYNFFGNLLSIVLLWYAVGSVNSLFKNPYIAITAVVVLSLLILLVLRKIKVKKL
jgi:membrane protein DedA with SNARE-associated domain